jgi:hypothetical protein
MSMRVAAVYNTTLGLGFWPYTPEHVRSLRNQLKLFGHELVVIGEDEPIHYQPRFAGWWSKMLAYAPEYAHLRPMLVLDLDNYVMRSLAPLLELDPTKLWLIRRFLSHTHLPEMGLCTVPDAPLADEIWAAALANDHARPPGDLIGRFPFSFMVDVVDGILSYEIGSTAERRPADARMVLFHGRRKPPEVTGWALDWWTTSLN